MRRKIIYDKFSECVGKTADELFGKITFKITIDDQEILKRNPDTLKLLLDNYNNLTFYANDYESLRFIENYLKDFNNCDLYLIDDFENKDRSHIKPEEFKKGKLIIPFSYIMWNIDFKNNANVYSYLNSINLIPFSTNGYNIFSVEKLDEIKNKVQRMFEKFKCESDLEKIVAISSYLQNKVQYVGSNNIARVKDDIYITDSGDYPTDVLTVSDPINVLFNEYGYCFGIAHATVLLLNNPWFNVNVRTAHTEGHSWNVVKLPEGNYHIDNTWCITRNADKYSESAKAKSFSDDYLLFGEEKASLIAYHKIESKFYDIEDEDFPRARIKESKNRLCGKLPFDNYKKPKFPSKIKND